MLGQHMLKLETENVLFTIWNSSVTRCWFGYFQIFLKDVTNKYCCICFSDEKDHLRITPLLIWMKKSVNEFLLGFWTGFRYYEPLLIMPRWKFFSSMFSEQVALQSFFQKVAKIKIGHHFYCKKPFVTPTFCKRNFSRMHGFGDMNFLSQTVISFIA